MNVVVVTGRGLYGERGDVAMTGCDRALAEGSYARNEGLTRSANPYDPEEQTDEHRAWNAGYYQMVRCEAAVAKGIEARNNGMSRRLNPYLANSREHQAWNDGFDELIGDEELEQITRSVGLGGGSKS